jgi:hypothetical protein
LSLLLAWSEAATTQPILPGPLATLDLKDAIVAPTGGVPKGRLTIGQHYTLDPGWLNPIEHATSLTQ